MQVDYEDKFKALATDGYIGCPSPSSPLAYAYIRVSSDEQGAAGHSGLPRQIEHIHEAANRAGVRVPYNLLFADDYTGFELERPSFTKLRAALKDPSRPTDFVVFEELDRMARKAWMQAYLLEEFDTNHIKPIFWKEINSRLEAYITGAISETGIRQSLARMADGTRLKAISGRVTSKHCAYGYRFVDSDGKVSDKARRDTHYGIHPDEGPVVALIFTRLASGDSARQIVRYLNDTGVPPPKRYSEWDRSFISKLVKNEVYKGFFCANRWQTKKVPKTLRDGSTVNIRRITQLPSDEWILVPVPAIVTEAIWEDANRQLVINTATSPRNAKQDYLLTGLVKCKECGRSIIGGVQHGKRKKDGERYHYRRYWCSSRLSAARMSSNNPVCTMPSMSGEVLDKAVWQGMIDTARHPERLLKSLDAKLGSDENREMMDRVKFLEGELAKISSREARWKKLYMDGVVDEVEYIEDRNKLKSDRSALEIELRTTMKLVLTPEVVVERKAHLLLLSEQVKTLKEDVPFEMRKRLLQLTITSLEIDTRAQKIYVSGTFQDVWEFENTSARRSTHKLSYSAVVSFSGEVLSASL